MLANARRFDSAPIRRSELLDLKHLRTNVSRPYAISARMARNLCQDRHPPGRGTARGPGCDVAPSSSQPRNLLSIYCKWYMRIASTEVLTDISAAKVAARVWMPPQPTPS